MIEKEEKKYCPDCNIVVERCLFCWEKEMKKKLRGK